MMRGRVQFISTEQKCGVPVWGSGVGLRCGVAVLGVQDDNADRDSDDPKDLGRGILFHPRRASCGIR